MRVLVTGGAGFIGSHLVDVLVGLGHNVQVLDNYSTGSPFHLMHAHQRGVRTHRGTVTWWPDVEKAVGACMPDVVYHLAAQIDVRRSVDSPVEDATANVIGTLHMLRAAAEAGVKRFVFISSAAVYGSAGVGGRVGPETPYRPISPYGASKLAAEGYVAMWDRLTTLQGVWAADPVKAVTGSMQCTTVCLSNVYGPRQREGVGAVNIFARRLLAGGPVTLYGDGGNFRDYVHVDTAVDALLRAGLRDHPMPRMLVGTGVGTSDRELLALVAKILDVEPVILNAPARPEDIRSMIFPGYPGAITLEEGIRSTLAGMKRETSG